MLAIIAVIITGAILTSGLVIAASMLSSRLSRAEEGFVADEFEVELPNPRLSVGDAPQSTS